MTQQMDLPSNTAPSKSNPKLLVLLLPVFSCSLSAIIGILIGQAGNLIYKILGDTAMCMTLPGFAGLFILTFALSFFGNRLFKKIFASAIKEGNQ